MSAPARTLYQFPFSHYCEKTRWNLDAKGLAYRVENVLPGPHRLLLRRLSRRTTVPLLVDQGQAIVDSTEIALHLERAHPSPALLPTGEAERQRVLELETYFDEVAGIHVRRWAYGQLLDSPLLGAVILREYPGARRLLGNLLLPVLRRVIRREYQVRPEKVAESHALLSEGLERLERQIEGDPTRYLVGNMLTLADITAATLYAPLVGVPESPWPESLDALLSPTFVELRKSIRARPAGQWVLQRYKVDRAVRHRELAS
jgi:glutathione S-transferase